MAKFYFNTGVKQTNSSYLGKGDIWAPAVGGSMVRLIPFECDDVPEGAALKFLCNDPNLESQAIVREVRNTTMLSKYAYFTNPSQT